MSEHYKRITMMEREEISIGLAQGWRYQEIARHLGRSPSTISREIARNSDSTGYRAVTAQTKAAQRCFRKPRKLVCDGRLRQIVLRGLRKQWSPQQISARLKQDYPNDEQLRVSAETIYTYLYVLPRGELRRELLGYLRQHHKKRRPRSRGEDRRGQIPDMISIEERPADVADRTVPGHWEGDLILGAHHQSALGTLVERTTRTTLLIPLKARDAQSVRKAFARRLRALPKQMKLSLTYDRGKEMAEHRLFTEDTQMQVYFAHPQSPWERGTNENTNGLIRQYFPKGTDFNAVSYYSIMKAQDRLNGRPRKVLNWKTPYEAFSELLR
ncbi:IS30 family transposase [Thiohalophilus thiocyanatoxydans]|uniref:IS30 family transposase n=1 Tax=Thiohalophilus thiocyanatoxydans TaxID=381308 RepID=A0A4R8IHS0_9GAMM|nr:IS30 family transposase [Thiohalophilus thiocyanatoxydans]TDX96744.1 IS30 family transposase [Thiohalophilus thiocyanatoxydans]